jgi:hypothetical protein
LREGRTKLVQVIDPETGQWGPKCAGRCRLISAINVGGLRRLEGAEIEDLKVNFSVVDITITRLSASR